MTYSNQIKTKAISFFKQGMATETIAKILPPCSGQIRRWLRELGITKGVKHIPKHITQKAVELYENGDSVTSISNQLGVKKRAVYTWLKKARVFCENPRHWPNKIIEQAQDLWQDGLNTGRIEQKIGVSRHTIAKWVRKTGLKPPSQRRIYDLEQSGKRLEWLRKTKEYQEWRSAVLERDGWTCQTCGRVGKDIHAHHILSFTKYPQSRFDVNNGIALCQTHHKEKHKAKIA